MRCSPSSSNFGSVLVDCFFTDFGFFQPFFSDHLWSLVFFSIGDDGSSVVTGGIEAALLCSPELVFQTFGSGVFDSDISDGVSAPLSQSGRSS